MVMDKSSVSNPTQVVDTKPKQVGLGPDLAEHLPAGRVVPVPDLYRCRSYGFDGGREVQAVRRVPAGARRPPGKVERPAPAQPRQPLPVAHVVRRSRGSTTGSIARASSMKASAVKTIRMPGGSTHHQ